MRSKPALGVKRSTPLLLLALVIGACSGPPSNQAVKTEEMPPDQAASVTTVVDGDGDGLWATTTDGRQLLADDGKYYEARVSPDGRFIAADIAVFSNLQVTRLYRRPSGSEPWQPAANVSETAWKAAAQAQEFTIEDVINPRTRFVAWSEDGTALELEVSGTLPDGSELRHTHSVQLEAD